MLKLPNEHIMRKRSMMGYIVEFGEDGKIVTLQEDYKKDTFKPGQVLQRQARLYEEFTPELKNDPEFLNFINNTLAVC